MDFCNGDLERGNEKAKKDDKYMPDALGNWSSLWYFDKKYMVEAKEDGTYIMYGI